MTTTPAGYGAPAPWTGAPAQPPAPPSAARTAGLTLAFLLAQGVCAVGAFVAYILGSLGLSECNADHANDVRSGVAFCAVGTLIAALPSIVAACMSRGTLRSTFAGVAAAIGVVVPW